ncbi:MAG: hypothetical protein RLZZ450_1526 [Pseudomonadota bacterium]|jgi:GNAT superfamily N-acetyltransferase
MSETTSYSQLSSEDQAGFDELYALYRSALPEHEQKSRAQLLAMLETPGYLFLCAERAQRLAGFAVVYQCQTAALALLEYLAVAESERRSGLGASLFMRAERHAADSVFLIEMDAPSASDPFSVRRSSFYTRQGCRRVEGLTYILPLPGKLPPPMWLLTLEARDQVPRSELAGWLCTLYSEVYDCEQSDPRIARMLLPLAEETCIVDLPEGKELRLG